MRWIPVHIRVDYNEPADELVKQERDRLSKISTMELADICTLITKKEKSSIPKRFEWQHFTKLNTSSDTYSAIISLRSKHA